MITFLEYFNHQRCRRPRRSRCNAPSDDLSLTLTCRHRPSPQFKQEPSHKLHVGASHAIIMYFTHLSPNRHIRFEDPASATALPPPFHLCR